MILLLYPLQWALILAALRSSGERRGLWLLVVAVPPYWVYTADAFIRYSVLTISIAVLAGMVLMRQRRERTVKMREA